MCLEMYKIEIEISDKGISTGRPIYQLRMVTIQRVPWMDTYILQIKKKGLI